MAGMRAQKLIYSQRTLKHRVLSDISRLIGCFLQELLFCKLEIYLTEIYLMTLGMRKKRKNILLFFVRSVFDIKGDT